MIPLRLKEHLGILRVEMLEEGEDFPEAEGYAHALKFELEELGVDLLCDEKVSWDDRDLTSAGVLGSGLEDFLFEFFLQFCEAVILGLDGVFDVV
jgi:hypothetical protein